VKRSARNLKWSLWLASISWEFRVRVNSRGTVRCSWRQRDRLYDQLQQENKA